MVDGAEAALASRLPTCSWSCSDSGDERASGSDTLRSKRSGVSAPGTHRRGAPRRRNERADVGPEGSRAPLQPSRPRRERRSRTRSPTSPTSGRCRSVSCGLFSRRSPNGASFALSKRWRRPLRDLPRRARPARSRLACSASHRARDRASAARIASSKKTASALFGLVLVALALMAGVTAFALSQRSEAREQAREAKAHELEALARGVFETDPERGLALPWKLPCCRRHRVLRETLATHKVSRSQGRAIRRALSGLPKAATRGVGAAAGGQLSADPSNDRTREEIETGARPARASFPRAEVLSLVGADGRLRLVRPNGSWSPSRRERRPGCRALGQRKARRQLRRDGHASDRGGLRRAASIF